jgi:cytoskeletal protein CcmA (bactofilin family)
MFSKPTKSALQGRMDTPATPAATSPPQGRKPRVASLISSDITIEGNLIGDGELQIDGTVKGDVKVAKLTIGDTGHVEGTISAEVVEVRGRIIGALSAKQVRLYGTAYVDGDITHEQLAMETGAFFQGRSLKFSRVAPPPAQAALAAPTAAPEPKTE